MKNEKDNRISDEETLKSIAENTDDAVMKEAIEDRLKRRKEDDGSVCKRVQIKEFDSVDEQLKWLVDNQEILKSQRRAESKKADSVAFISYALDGNGERIKEAAQIGDDVDELKIVCVINTTNLLDSHYDVHIPGLWKKSLSETKLFYLCQEHDLSFKGIISDNIKAYAEKKSWSDLGFDYKGETEALVFEAVVEKSRNAFMFDQYKRGFVREHSVRMRTVKEYFCVNSDAYPDQYDNWKKYIKYVANREAAESRNFFWAVTEAKIIEGSAVVKGSNFATPTISIAENKSEAATGTFVKNEPSYDTQSSEIFINPNI